MLAGPALWATLWIAWGLDGPDFRPSEMRPVAPRSAWRVVRPSEGRSVPGRTDDDLHRVSDTEEAEGAPVSDGDAPPRRAIARPAGPGPVSPRRNWPPEIAEALARLDVARRAVMAGQAVEDWRFDAVRAGYEAMLRTHRGNPDLRMEIQSRLADLGRLEAAAEAARKVEEILSRSHRRDQNLARTAESLAAQDRNRSRAYRAIGMIQPSSHKTEGRKLYALIAADGSRRAYLDVPPGIDADRLIARRVGVRGAVNYNDELGSRLITVRDIEELGITE